MQLHKQGAESNLSLPGVRLHARRVAIYDRSEVLQQFAQRTHEIGIRVALGANHNDVLRLVLGEGVKVILAGILIGVMGALAVTRFLSSMLYGIGTTDPITFGSVSFLLSVVALVACYVPARRAMRLNPLIALRCE